MQVRSLVGFTSSQKPIYQYEVGDSKHLSQGVSKFTDEDCFDAFAVFDYLMLVYWRRFGELSHEYADGGNMMNFYREHLSSEYIEKRQAEICLTTAFDVSKYGRKHCVPYLQEIIGS
jgi:hypothetical protein